MIFLYILFGLFFYFLLMWSFRVAIFLLMLKVFKTVKENIEREVKGKKDQLKGGGKK